MYPYKNLHLRLGYLHVPQCPVTSGKVFLLSLKSKSLKEKLDHFERKHAKPPIEVNKDLAKDLTYKSAIFRRALLCYDDLFGRLNPLHAVICA